MFHFDNGLLVRGAKLRKRFYQGLKVGGLLEGCCKVIARL